jgi:hypothetical protein
MKKITTSFKKKKDRHRLKPELLANEILLASGFEEGKVAYVKYLKGKLIIRFKSKLKDK